MLNQALEKVLLLYCKFLSYKLWLSIKNMIFLSCSGDPLKMSRQPVEVATHSLGTADLNELSSGQYWFCRLHDKIGYKIGQVWTFVLTAPWRRYRWRMQSAPLRSRWRTWRPIDRPADAKETVQNTNGRKCYAQYENVKNGLFC